MSKNPLLVSINEFIDYSAVTPAHISEAIPELIDYARKEVDKYSGSDTPITWDGFIDPIQNACEPLWRAWSVAAHLNAVVNTPELRDAFNKCLPEVTEFSTWISLHENLYNKYKALANSNVFSTLPDTRKRIINLALRDFKLGGAELAGEKRQRYKEISEQQAQASQKFSENVLDTIDQWSYVTSDQSELDGLPSDVIEAARLAAEQDGLEGYKLTLQMPCYIPVMQYARNRDLRYKFYRAYATIASDQAKPDLDNSKIIENLLALRAEEAQLLGYNTYAELQLQTRMANDVSVVQSFLDNLANKSKEYAIKDLNELKDFAKDHLDIDNLEPWDIGYASEQLRQQRYNYSDEEVKQYFTQPQVINGLAQVVNKLFGVTLRKVNASVWHTDVQTYEVVNHNNDVKGILYMDLFARQGKRSGAWVGGERDRRRINNHVRLPIVYLTCNFASAQGDKPALLTHDDVITLFHESGHAFHALLSEVDDPAASAFSAVEWDAIELPSQFMENFCWEWSVIRAMSSHVETGNPLPRQLYDKMLKARNFQSGMQMVRQLEFAMFDMAIHNKQKALSIEEVLNELNLVRQKVAVVIPPSWHRFPHNFSHLFAGGYSAGYYSYKWAEVLSADAYSAFEEKAKILDDGTKDTLNPDIGRKFLEEILAVGGIRPTAESFKKFRGREPSIDALLRHNGMAS